MNFAVFKGETSIEELVGRLFRPSDKSARSTSRAAEVLLKANPQLEDLGKVPVGTLIRVPEDAPPLVASEAAPAGVVRQMEVTRQVEQSLQLLHQKLQEIDTRAEEGANAFLALAKSKEAKALMRGLSDLDAQAPDLVASARALVRSVKERRDSRAETVAGFQKSLQAPGSPRSHRGLAAHHAKKRK